MKSLAIYLESIFKNPIDVMNTVDIDDIVSKFNDKRNFDKGFNGLLKFVKEIASNHLIKPEEYEKLKDDCCYILFAWNNQTGELTAPPFMVKIYDGGSDSVYSMGGDPMMIGGEENIVRYSKKHTEGSKPKEDITDLATFGVVNMKVYELTGEVVNQITGHMSWVQECGEGPATGEAATPGNTMGMGNPSMPVGDRPGSGDQFTYNPRKPSPKKEKKDKSKTHKI